MKQTLKIYIRIIFNAALLGIAACNSGQNAETHSVSEDSGIKSSIDTSALALKILPDSALQLSRRINDSLDLAKDKCNQLIADINNKLKTAVNPLRKEYLVSKEQLVSSETDISNLKLTMGTALLVNQSKSLRSTIKNLADAKIALEGIAERLDRLISILNVVDVIINTLITGGINKAPDVATLNL